MRIRELLTPKRICVFFIAVAVYCLLFLILYNMLIFGDFDIGDNLVDNLQVFLRNALMVLLNAVADVFIVFINQPRGFLQRG